MYRAAAVGGGTSLKKERFGGVAWRKGVLVPSASGERVPLAMCV